MNSNWRLLKTGKHDAATNMAIDEVILLRQETCPQPTLRLYDWSLPAFSFGYFQKITTEIDVNTCGAHGVELVRRMTGGGIVVHGWDVTYSIIVPHGNGVIPSDISASYCWIANRLLEGFHQIHVPATLQGSKSRASAVGPNTCLANPAEHDVMLNGKKIAGVSQRRNRVGGVYQGYIALNMPPPEILTLASKFPDYQKTLTEKSTAINLKQHSPKNRKQIEDAVIAGFKEVPNTLLVASDLSTEELDAVKSLAQSKYTTSEWTYRR